MSYRRDGPSVRRLTRKGVGMAAHVGYTLAAGDEEENNVRSVEMTVREERGQEEKGLLQGDEVSLDQGLEALTTGGGESLENGDSQYGRLVSSDEHAKGAAVMDVDTAGVAEPGGEDEQHLSSDIRTFINTLISFVGAGILGIPFAFRQGGLMLSSGMMFSVGGTCTYCMWILIRCKYHVSALSGKGDVTYSDVCYHALGRPGLVLVESALVVSQSGFSTAYIVFIARNFHQIFNVAKVPVVLTCMPGLVLLCLVKHLKYLAPFSLIAEVVNMVGLAVVFVNDVEFIAIDHETISWAHWPAFPFVFGVGVYCFEGMGMVIPIEKGMKNKSHFIPILALVMFLYTSLCVCSGALGYLAFGDNTQDIILLNLGATVYTIAVKLSFCVGLYFTFPIMMVPVWEVLEMKWLRPWEASYGYQRDGLRGLWVISTVLLACVIPNFGLFISLIGSSCCSLLAFILPILCFNQLERSVGNNLGLLKAALHGVILAGGVFAMVSGTVDALHKFYQGGRGGEG